MKNCIYILMICGLCACQQWVLPEPYNDEPQKNFEIFYNDMLNHYPFFEQDRIDWPSFASGFRSRVTSSTSTDALFGIFTEMLLPLSDGHISISAPSGKVWINPRVKNYFLNYSETFVKNRYFKNQADFNLNKPIRYGWLPDSVLYIYIETFALENISESFKPAIRLNAKKIIIDVRSNGGGFRNEMEKMLASFGSGNYGYEEIKTGPTSSDFTNKLPLSALATGSTVRSNAQVVVLTNRLTASAAENLVFGLKAFKKSLTVGDTTFGAISAKSDRVLPNGIAWQTANSKVSNLQNVYLESKGIAPDFVVNLTVQDTLNQRERIIEKALTLFQ